MKDNGDVIGQIVGKDTLSTLTDRIRNSIRPSIYPTVKKEEYDGKTIISVSFKGTNKPYAYKGAFYIRVEDQTLPIDPLVLRKLIQEGNEYNTKWENELTNYGIEDVDENALENFYKQSVAIGRIVEHKHTSEELLTQLNLMVDKKLTNAGYFLFSNKSPLVLKAAIYPTEERLNPIYLKRYEGNIFNLIHEAINYINQKMSWKVVVDNVERKEIPEVPVVALREIIINSFVHCDYISDTEHQITFDPSKIEIYNPGVFKDYTPIDYVNGTIPSRTKHKVIQGILFKAFDIETLGRGLKRMDKFCKESNVKWDYKKYPFGFTFIFLRNNLGEDEDSLSSDAKKILEYMYKNDGILESNAKACEVLNKKECSARKIINELDMSEKIKREGTDKVGFWKLV